MLVHNEYLQELGVGKNTYPLGNSCSHETELDERAGVIPCQTWNMNLTLAMELYTYFRAFKDVKPGHPVCLTKEEWDDILDKIIDGFANYIKHRDDTTPNKDVHERLCRSLNLMKEWWEAFWW